MGAPMKAAAMKGKTAKALTKGAIAQSPADACELKKAQCMKVIDSLAEVGTKEVSKTGIFTIPGLCRIKTRVKPATKAGKDYRQGFRSCRLESVRLSTAAPEGRLRVGNPWPALGVVGWGHVQRHPSSHSCQWHRK